MVVNGFPKQSSDECGLPSNILAIFGTLKIPINASDLISCRRMTLKTASPPIILSFTNEETKQKIFTQWKDIAKIGKHPANNQLFKELHERFQLPINSYINISEEETKYTHNLFKEAQHKLRGKFKYVWKKNGNIYTKLDDNNKSIKIVSSSQIDNILFRYDC